LPHLKCVSVNIQPIPHALLEGDEEIFLTEKKYIEHRLGKHTIHLHPQGFVQTNKAVAEKLYQTAADWIKELQIERFAELFCGQGAFSFMTASTVKEAVGFEVNSEAVNEANRSAQAQGLKHLTFKCSDAAKVGTELRNFAPQLVLVNPPRRGLGESVKLFEETQYPYLIYS